MSKQISFFINIIIIFLLLSEISYTAEVSIVPLKKPILNKKIKEEKLSKNIIKPKNKPTLNKEVKEEKLSKSAIVPEEKPKQKIIKKEEKTKIVKKQKKQINLLIPKSKPLIVKKEIIKIQKKSKYFKKRDFDLARKAIIAIEKRKWFKALSYAKKARNKSLYFFIQWKYLLTHDNQASFYDYQLFIKRNPNYPRIGRIKYLAEHKLSTKNTTPKKIITWFAQNEPTSGFGKLILGESLISIGNNQIGIKLIKEGWITAKLSRKEMKLFRKKYKKYLTPEDYIKRADYLAWENKYWDLKRMLKYLPKDERALYNARQILMSNS